MAQNGQPMAKTAQLLSAFILLLLSASFSPEPEWQPLLDKNLSQWGMYLSYRHAPAYSGQVPVDARGKAVQPIGYGKNEANVFSVSEAGGEPVLRISGEIYGCIFTKAEYENYHLKAKVKWGTKKWDPRTDKLMDSGILYHSVGEAGKDYWRSWMLSQEFQVMEGHMGDYWNIANSAMDIRAFMPEGTMNPVADAGQPFLSIGAGSQNGGFCMRSENRESPAGEWTQLELICHRGKSLHIVNGQVVMVLQNSRYAEGGTAFPLTKGKIQLLSEAAETFFRDVKIRPLKAMPTEYQKYFE
jgi:hypothetical protein